MIAMLAKLIPFRDYVYAAIAAAVLIWYNVHVTELEHHYAADKVAAVVSADAAATKKANDAADKVIAADRASYTASLQKAQEAFDANSKATAAANAADIARLRDITASYQKANALLSGALTASATGKPGPGSTESLGTVPAELGAELAGALRTTNDQLQLCYAERDSLTGK